MGPKGHTVVVCLCMFMCGCLFVQEWTTPSWPISQDTLYPLASDITGHLDCPVQKYTIHPKCFVFLHRHILILKFKSFIVKPLPYFWIMAVVTFFNWCLIWKTDSDHLGLFYNNVRLIHTMIWIKTDHALLYEITFL